MIFVCFYFNVWFKTNIYFYAEMHLYFVPFTDAELIINLLIDCLVSCALLTIIPSYNDMGLPVKECFCQSSLSLCPHAALDGLLEKMMHIGRAFLNHKYCCKSEKCPGLDLQRTTSLNLEVWGGLNCLSVVLVTSSRCKPISFYNKYLCSSCPLNLILPNQTSTFATKPNNNFSQRKVYHKLLKECSDWKINIFVSVN